MPTSRSASATVVDPSVDDGFLFPTETEIYILPNGQVVFADLPAELIDLADTLSGKAAGHEQLAESAPHDHTGDHSGRTAIG